MSVIDEPRPRARHWLLLGLLFVGAAAGSAQLLRPLVATEAPREAVATAPAPVAVPAAPSPAPEPTVPATIESPIAAPPAPAAYAPDFKGPRIAVVLTDVGDNPAQSRAAIEALPGNVGLAFTPYPDVRALVRAAKADGHEIWAGVPMQPKSWPRVRPGRNTLLVGAEPAANIRSLDWTLARVEGAAGITGIMGSAFTESETAMQPVLREAGRRGLAYIDARASARSVGFATAQATGVRAAVNDRFLDESGRIADHLAALEQQARREGSAIGFARPLPQTIAALQAWAATLEGKGILLVPPSSLAE